MFFFFWWHLRIPCHGWISILDWKIKIKIVGDSYLHVQQKQQWLCVSASLPKPAASRIRSHQGREKRADEQWVGAPLPSYRRQSPLPSQLWTPNPPKGLRKPPFNHHTPHPTSQNPPKSWFFLFCWWVTDFLSREGSVINSLFRCCYRLSNWIRGQESTPCWKPI